MTKDQVLAVLQEMPAEVDVDQLIEQIIARYHQNEPFLQGLDGQAATLEEVKLKIRKRQDEATLQAFKEEDNSESSTETPSP